MDIHSREVLTRERGGGVQHPGRLVLRAAVPGAAEDQELGVASGGNQGLVHTLTLVQHHLLIPIAVDEQCRRRLVESLVERAGGDQPPKQSYPWGVQTFPTVTVTLPRTSRRAVVRSPLAL
jgi:hypothetical protein